MIASSKSTLRKRRLEKKVIDVVRAACVERDGWCRIGKNLTVGLGACGGPSEWSHLGQFKRAKTRRMEPEIRHDTRHTAMLCAVHHDRYDAHDFDIEELTDRGADGPLAYVRDGRRFEESDSG